jgi:FkbM family methyltransferase
MIKTTEAYGLTFSVPGGDLTIGRCLDWHGEFGRVGLEWLTETASAIGEGEYLDVGCNVGALSLPLARELPRWRVLGIEAHRELVHLFNANAAQNRLDNVRGLHAVAGREGGVLSFPTPPLSESRNFGELAVGTASTARQPVPIIPIDDVASSDTRLIKIDVEGYELEALAGAAATLRQQRASWLIETSKGRPEVARPVMKVMAEAGYRLHWLFIPFVVATPLRPGKPPPSHLGDWNVAALPPGTANVWDLPEIRSLDEDWPAHLSEMPYLRRFGY